MNLNNYNKAKWSSNNPNMNRKFTILLKKI